MKILGFVKSYIEISVLKFLGIKMFFWKIRYCHYKKLLILRHLVPFICILLSISFLVIFLTFINFRLKMT